MKRIHLFEFTDLPWYPPTFRRIQTDYLRFVAALGMNYKSRERRYKAALTTIAEAFQQLGIDFESMDDTSESRLVTVLTLGETTPINRERCGYAAALFKEAGSIYAAQGQVDASSRNYLKALYLLLETSRLDGGSRFAGYVPAVEELVAELWACGFDLSVETRWALMEYYEQRGAYGKAEDVLFEMIEASDGDNRIVEMGLDFYERLKRKSDEALVAGNLPRKEVEMGLTELKVFQR
ncbi:MAG: hypothetical protein JXA33_24930 [Anaerolineae bacterium]|nr:hypothetical protein [Anaerolineae bacterium]